MMTLGEIIEKLDKLKSSDRMGDLVYMYNERDDEYSTIRNIRIDSENDIVIDIVES